MEGLEPLVAEDALQIEDVAAVAPAGGGEGVAEAARMDEVDTGVLASALQRAAHIVACLVRAYS